MNPAPPSTAEEFPAWLRALVGVPLASVGFMVAFYIGFALCAYVASRIGGGQARPELLIILPFWLLFGIAPLSAGIFLLQPSPAGKRFWRWTLFGMVILFLVVGVDGFFGPDNWHQIFRHEKLPATDAASLGKTIVSPHLEQAIVPGKNVLWCGTFQLAWNEACQLAGGDLPSSGEQPLMIAALNKHSFTRESLDDSSYVAMAGFAGDGIHEKIQKAIDAKFHGQVHPEFIPDKSLTPRPQDFIAYACLYKYLSFPTPFERLDNSLKFGDTPVPAFGLGPYKESLEKMYPQVLILDYQSEDDFIIELKTKSDGDRLILAKMQTQATLADTLTNIASRIAGKPIEAATTNDLLQVPRIKFDITRHYSEIVGLHLIPKDPAVAKDLYVQSAVQNTKFELDENGVKLKSEASMSFACAKHEEPVPKHKMIFDKPFLILMQRKGAPTPYFALWVDNPEILVSWK